MSYEAVHSILARCLLDAGFLDRLRGDPEGALGGYGLSTELLDEFRRADLDRLADLAGFIVKVKHNHLWEDFPYSCILLRRLRLELDVFRAYSAEYQRLRSAGGVSRTEGIERFLDFLRRYLDEQRADRRHAVVGDVVAHERFRWEILRELRAAAAPADAVPERGPEGDPERRADGVGGLLRRVPALRTGVRLGRFDHDPLEIVDSLRQQRFALEGLEARSRWLAYVATADPASLQLLEVEPAAALLLSLVDGRSTVGTLLDRADLDARRLGTTFLRTFLAHAEASGILVLG